MHTVTREKRLRVQSKRSSTGCQTCRTRRIKCDERWPACGRCIASKRLCSYLRPDNRTGWSRFVIYSVPRACSQYPDLAKSQKRALHYYRCRAALRLTAPFRCDFWGKGICALADQYDFVQSALIALSMLHEAYFDADSRERLHNQAMGHYNCAIRIISHAAAGELSTDAVLVATKMFHNIETLRGGFQRALMHAECGLRILCQDPRPLLESQPSYFHESLRRSFLELQNQIADFSHADGPMLNHTLRQWRNLAVPFGFDTVGDCLHGLEMGINMMWEMLEFRDKIQQASGDEAHTLKLKSEMQDLFSYLMSMTKDWADGVDRLVATAALSNDDDEKASMLVLQIQRTMVDAMIARFPSTIYLQEDLAIECVDLCEDFLRRYNNKDHAMRAFSLSTGVVRTLFQLSWRTNVERTRLKCLELLRTANRREGVWDSRLAYRLAHRASKLKHEIAGKAGDTGGPVRVTSVRFISEQTARVVYSTACPEKIGIAGHSSGRFSPVEEDMKIQRRVGYVDLRTLHQAGRRSVDDETVVPGDKREDKGVPDGPDMAHARSQRHINNGIAMEMDLGGFVEYWNINICFADIPV